MRLPNEFIEWTQQNDGVDLFVNGTMKEEMNTQFENTMKANAKKLDEIIGLYSKYDGKYIGYNGSDIFIAETFAQAIEQAESKFGEKTPFVIRKIGHEVILSNFVK